MAEGIKELLKPENVQIVESVKDWQDAIHTAVAPLEKGGYVEPRYAENIIKDTEKLGPYYVLAPDIALIHARPEEGAIKKQLAVTVVHEPVIFSEDAYPARVLFALAAEDDHSHIEAIKVLATFCMDDERVKRLVECTNPAEAYELIITTPTEE